MYLQPFGPSKIIKKSNIKTKGNLNLKTAKILNIGRFTDQKDQITLFKSLNILKNKINFEAIIVGKGVKEEFLKNYIKENYLENNLKLENFKNNSNPIIKETDLFILSSKFEGLPNVLLESLVLKK